MGQWIVVYDFEGTILTQYGADSIHPPIGVPYILLPNYQPSAGGMVIQKVDVTMEPHRLIFGNPIVDEQFSKLTLDEYKNIKQNNNKHGLEFFLKEHPLLWSDGMYYSVTKEDQIEMIENKITYDLKQSMGESWSLQWHSIDAGCRDFTEDEYTRLANDIVDFVYPYRRLEMFYKNKIYKATTKEAVDAVDIVYMMPIDTDLIR